MNEKNKEQKGDPTASDENAGAIKDGFLGQDGNLDARIKAALTNDVPKIYANGFVTSMTSGDILVVLEANGRSVGVLNLSFTVAKTLSLALGQAIANLEEKAGHEIMTTHLIDKAIAKSA